jgi:rubrerythrin
MYSDFAKTAEEGFADITARFRQIAEIEKARRVLRKAA